MAGTRLRGPRPRGRLARAFAVLAPLAWLAGCAQLEALVAGPTEAEIAAMPLTDVLALADRGNGLAQHRLCHGYSFGQGVKQDHARAFEWCTRAAAHENLDSAKTLLGDLYFHGRGVEQNLDQARAWYTRAAERGHAHAQLMLGVIYQEGRGVEPDAAVARHWLESAARAGSTLARDRLERLPDK